MMREETIATFYKSVLDDPEDMGYTNNLVVSLVEEIIRLKVKYEGMITPENWKEE